MWNEKSANFSSHASYNELPLAGPQSLLGSSTAWHRHCPWSYVDVQAFSFSFQFLSFCSGWMRSADSNLHNLCSGNPSRNETRAVFGITSWAPESVRACFLPAPPPSSSRSVCLRGCRAENKILDNEGVCWFKHQNLQMLEMRRLLRNDLVQPTHFTNKETEATSIRARGKKQ